MLRISFFIGIVQCILWFGHFVVYKTFIKFFGLESSGHLNTIRLVFFILSILFLLGNLVSAKYYGPVARGFYTTGAIWMGTLYWLFWASLISWIIFAISKFALPGKDISMVPMVLLIAAILTSAYGVWNSYQTKVQQVTIHLENLPEVWKGKKVVLVADTHLGHVRNLSFAKKIADLITEQKPDAVLIPGDYYDGPLADYSKLAEPFGAMPTTYGVFFAAGNHEEFRPKNMYFEGLSKGGVKVLDNELVTIEGLQIIGVGYFDTVNADSQRTLLQKLNIDKTKPSILIKHSPSHIDAAESEGISLQVSGHTHMGQVFPLNFITKSVYKNFNYKLKRLGNTQVYTTSGAGTWGPPQRVGTNSEIVVITLE
jgi:predicted MPP superfamily phosphohydrolase